MCALVFLATWGTGTPTPHASLMGRTSARGCRLAPGSVGLARPARRLAVRRDVAVLARTGGLRFGVSRSKQRRLVVVWRARADCGWVGGTRLLCRNGAVTLAHAQPGSNRSGPRSGTYACTGRPWAAATRPSTCSRASGCRRSQACRRPAPGRLPWSLARSPPHRPGPRRRFLMMRVERIPNAGSGLLALGLLCTSIWPIWWPPYLCTPPPLRCPPTRPSRCSCAAEHRCNLEHMCPPQSSRQRWRSGTWPC